MAKVIPFKAVRPTRAIVGLVASRSYQSYTIDERESRMAYNPYSFLHIVNPGYKYDQVITGEERYKLVKNRYLEFKEDHVFITDNKPSIYVYKIVSFKIRPQNMVLKDNIAVVCYLIDVNLENREQEKSVATFRIIHTWLYENGKWQLLGGMSAK